MYASRIRVPNSTGALQPGYSTNEYSRRGLGSPAAVHRTVSVLRTPLVTVLANIARTCRNGGGPGDLRLLRRSEEHTSELQSLMRISYAVFCLKKKNTILSS